MLVSVPANDTPTSTNWSTCTNDGDLTLRFTSSSLLILLLASLVAAQDDSVREKKEPREKLPHLGGCVLRSPTGKAPEKLRHVTTVQEVKGKGPFTKEITACGIRLPAEKGVPDAFLLTVGKTAAEIFATSKGTDSVTQNRVLGHLYRYRALLPVPRTERSFERLLRRHEPALQVLRRENSLCDIIMAKVPKGQVMEVVEHLLHAITNVGLHYEFPSEWGLSRKSQLWSSMQRAIKLGYYNIGDYKEEKRHLESEVYERILLQEYAYWFISTAWNLQKPYGPNEKEWTLSNPVELKKKLPAFFKVYEKTAATVLSAPSKATLDQFLSR